jgi:oligopeptide/dipeptide ABC transporter ATP-binding protein
VPSNVMTHAQPSPTRPVPEPLLRVEDLAVHYPAGRTGFWGGEKVFAKAVDGVTFDVRPGETLGLVGESGSGKSTTGKAILRRVPITRGRITFDGRDITTLQGEQLRRLRRDMQLVFQDPYGSLNPRMRVLDIVAEPLKVHGLIDEAEEASEKVVDLIEMCGLPRDAARRYPHAFSGGQRQRIGIARALALEPKFIVADEPVSALDVSIQAQIVNLLQELQRELGLTYLFIAHDLSVVRHISHRIAIMYAGQLVEVGDRDTIYERPTHPYTEALLSSVPIPDPSLQRRRQRIALPGEIPNPTKPPSGCRFHTRCPLAEERCVAEQPIMAARSEEHRAACWMR